MKTFKELKVWQKAHQLVLEIYKITRSFPKEERFGLVIQIRRSVSSIPTNIVEGFKRKSKKDFAYFLNIAESSLEETKYHLLLAHDLKYISNTVYNKLLELCDEIGKMLNGLQSSLK
ncbi:MAG: four helix bundle protein [Elusimicrobia bacterium]|nr:four helix bundle protein [Elusimicrobiota bacterium]